MALLKESTLIIESGRTEKNYWGDIWRYRELFVILAWRDVSVRYKQTIIGMGWAILQPLLTMLVLTLIFGKVAKLPSDGQSPYALLVLSGILPWYLFSSSLRGAADSLVDNEKLISKVYFPRMIVPAATMVTALVDFIISGFILVGLIAWYRFAPGWNILLLPLFVLLTLMASLGPGLCITSFNVKYRDFRYVIPFILYAVTICAFLNVWKRRVKNERNSFLCFV